MEVCRIQPQLVKEQLIILRSLSCSAEDSDTKCDYHVVFIRFSSVCLHRWDPILANRFTGSSDQNRNERETRGNHRQPNKWKSCLEKNDFETENDKEYGWDKPSVVFQPHLRVSWTSTLKSIWTWKNHSTDEGLHTFFSYLYLPITIRLSGGYAQNMNHPR